MILISAVLKNDSGAWPGDVLSLAQAACISTAIQNSQTHSTNDKLKRLLYFIHFAESVRHFIIPSGIVYTVP